MVFPWKLSPDYWPFKEAPPPPLPPKLYPRFRRNSSRFDDPNDGPIYLDNLTLGRVQPTSKVPLQTETETESDSDTDHSESETETEVDSDPDVVVDRYYGFLELSLGEECNIGPAVCKVGQRKPSIVVETPDGTTSSKYPGVVPPQDKLDINTGSTADLPTEGLTQEDSAEDPSYQVPLQTPRHGSSEVVIEGAKEDEVHPTKSTEVDGAKENEVHPTKATEVDGAKENEVHPTKSTEVDGAKEDEMHVSKPTPTEAACMDGGSEEGAG